MREDDLAAVMAIAAVVPTAPHWPPAEFLRMLRVIAEQPGRRGAWVATVDRVVQGFAIGVQAAGSAELEAVVVAGQARRRGLGAALLAEVVAWSRAVGATRLLLEARASNLEAIRLYTRRGFTHDGLRRGYYRAPDEDAVLLSLPLGGGEPGA